MAGDLEKPKAIGGKPIVVIAVKHDRVIRRDSGAAQEFLERFLADDVAADLILELSLPVEANSARDMARIVGLGIHVDLSQFDARFAQVLFHPVG